MGGMIWRISAAAAKAVYNATGRRIRDLPIRLEKLLL
jgi:CO/xanthine dehydrogenase Mo-binding subunit